MPQEKIQPGQERDDMAHCPSKWGEIEGISDHRDFGIGRLLGPWGVDLSNKISVHKPFSINFASSKLEKSLVFKRKYLGQNKAGSTQNTHPQKPHDQPKLIIQEFNFKLY